MSYFVKGLVHGEYLKKFAGMSEFVVISTTGISGVDNNIMRGELKKADMRAVVVQNSLMRRAVAELGLSAAGTLFGAGQCTVVFGGTGAPGVAKVVVGLAKKYKAIQLKGAFVEGNALVGEASVKSVAAMPTRIEMQGQVVQIALSPGGVIAGCVKTLIEKLEKEAA
jgi:large subunit ribosomal protein L10